jgi:hypothetical protein
MINVGNIKNWLEKEKEDTEKLKQLMGCRERLWT